MAIKIHSIVTGELESGLQTSILNSGAHPDIAPEDRLPFGYRYDIVRRDGSVHEGIMVPCHVWLLEGTDKKILVDTGLGDLDEVSEMQARYGVEYLASRTEDQDLVAGLARHGVRPEDIDIVILTHLHFDHIGNTELFTNARFIVQEAELGPGLNPPGFTMFYYPEYRYKIEQVRERMDVIEGDFEVEPGVRIVKIGGHSPGSAVVMVDTESGTVCLASDVLYNYWNLEHNWPMGAYWDIQELMDGYDRMRKEADIIVPQHDWKFHEYYPTGTIA